VVGIGELLFPAPYRGFAGASIRNRSPFPASPSIIPDGEISPVRLETKTFPAKPSRVHTRFKRWRAYATCDSVCSSSRPVGVLPISWDQSPSRSLLTEPPSPRAPSLQRRCPPSALLRAHAPIPAPPTSLSAICLIEGVLAACATHGWSRGPSRFWPALLSWSATSPTPAVRRVHLTSSSPTTSAFALAIQARLPASGTTTASRGVVDFGAADIP
jgi:hypothetical protein